MPGPSRGSIHWPTVALFFGFIVLTLAQSFLLKAPLPKNVSYSEFLALVDAGKLAEVQIRERDILGRPKTKENDAKSDRIKAERIPGQSVTTSFFDVLGVAPVAGRTFVSDDAVPQPNVVIVSERFWRQLRFQEFDVSEMSISSFLMIMANGDKNWLGLPIFTTRHFFHTMAFARKDSGINSPADYKGKRVGVPEFQQTGALWARGAMIHEFGCKQEDVEWWMERTPEHSHAGAVGFKPPQGTTLKQIPPEKSIG